MSFEKFGVLEQVLGSYFHQDWPDEFYDDAATLQAILESEPTWNGRIPARLQVGALA